MVRKLNAEQIYEKLSRFEKIYLVDVAELGSYEENHLPHAVHIPLTHIQTRAPMIFPEHGAEVIIYDDGEGKTAWKAARALEMMGYYNLFVYEEGRKNWLMMGFTSEVNVHPNPAVNNPAFPMRAA